MRQKIFDEIKARTKETDLSVPTRRGDWWYYGRSFEGKQYSVHCRCPVSDPDDWTPPDLDEHTEIPGEQVLLDENVEAEGHDFFSLGAASVSLDGNILAYSVDVKGDERYTCGSRTYAPVSCTTTRSPESDAGATWAADNRTVYYSTLDEAWRPDTIWRHRIGSGLPAHRVYHEPDERYWLGVGRTRSDKFVLIAAGSAVTSEVRYGDATDPQAEFTVVWPRRDFVEYSVEHAVVGGDDRFLILHNDGAENFTLVEAPVSDPTAVRTLIEHRDDVRLDSVDAFDGHLVVSYRSEALPKIQLWPVYPSGEYGHPEDFTFDSELTSAGLSGNPNWSAPKLRIGATSYTTPVRIYDVDLATGERTLLREQPVLGDYRPEDYVERRDWAVAPDGARVPISIVHKIGLQYPAPTLLYGYGAYEAVRGSALLHRAAVAARPRHGVRSRPRARRRRTRSAVVRARQDAREEEQLHRLHRRRTASRSDRCHPARELGGVRRQRRRSAGRSRYQHGAGVVRRHPRAWCRSSIRSPRSSTRRCRSPSPNGTSGETRWKTTTYTST